MDELLPSDFIVLQIAEVHEQMLMLRLLNSFLHAALLDKLDEEEDFMHFCRTGRYPDE